jgi:hypothetical protein
MRWLALKTGDDRFTAYVFSLCHYRLILKGFRQRR